MYNYVYHDLVNFRATYFSILIVCCGIFCYPASPTNYYHRIKKTDDYYLLTWTSWTHVMEDVWEHEAASYIRGYREDHPFASDTQEQHSSTLQSSEMRQRS